MLTERDPKEVEDKILKFMNMGRDSRVFVHHLGESSQEGGTIQNDITFAFFPQTEDLKVVELAVFTAEHVTNKNDYYRRIFEMELNPVERDGAPSTVEELMEDTRYASINGMPIFAFSFGRYIDSGNEWVCIHTIESVSVKYVFNTLQKFAEKELFGAKFEFEE